MRRKNKKEIYLAMKSLTHLFVFLWHFAGGQRIHANGRYRSKVIFLQVLTFLKLDQKVLVLHFHLLMTFSHTSLSHFILPFFDLFFAILTIIIAILMAPSSYLIDHWTILCSPLLLNQKIRVMLAIISLWTNSNRYLTPTLFAFFLLSFNSWLSLKFDLL